MIEKKYLFHWKSSLNSCTSILILCKGATLVLEFIEIVIDFMRQKGKINFLMHKLYMSLNEAQYLKFYVILNYMYAWETDIQ